MALTVLDNIDTGHRCVLIANANPRLDWHRCIAVAVTTPPLPMRPAVPHLAVARALLLTRMSLTSYLHVL